MFRWVTLAEPGDINLNITHFTVDLSMYSQILSLPVLCILIEVPILTEQRLRSNEGKGSYVNGVKEEAVIYVYCKVK
jgi:hypothetical protein